MKVFRLLGVACAVSAVFTACEPFEDTSWINNSYVYLDWKHANPETGMRPVELDSLKVFYYSQTDQLPDFSFPMTENIGQFDVRTNCYDIVVTHPSPYFVRDTKFRTTTIELPTRINHKAEVVITENPKDMIYLGVSAGTQVDWEGRRNVYVTMRRMLKELNFVVNIIDYEELMVPCTVDISGMASRMKVWNRQYDDETEAIQIFNIHKQGRHMNTEKCLTTFKGKVLSLGTVGRNILYFTFQDAKGRERVGKYDLTPYLADWNTDEVTVRMTIDATTDTVTLEGYEQGDTSDFVFDMNYYLTGGGK